MNTENVSRQDWIMGGVAVLLVIDLLFLPWFSITVGPLSLTLTATDAPDSWAGLFAVLATLVLIADLAIERFSPQTTVPALGNGRTDTRFIVACVAALFVALKFLLQIHFSEFGIGFYLGIILTAGLVYVTLEARGTRLGGNTNFGARGRV